MSESEDEKNDSDDDSEDDYIEANKVCNNTVGSVQEKRFYTSGTLRGIRISRLTKPPSLLYHDCLGSLN